MKVLFVSEWYPNRYDAMIGLFVQKHAMAVSAQGIDVCVLYLHHDTHINTREIVERTTNGVREVTVYYPNHYLSALRAGWRNIRPQWGMPDICQLNIIAKNAILPLWLKRHYNIPYTIIEHWSGYLPENGNYMRSSYLHRVLARTAVKHASQVLTVSQKLAENMQRCGLQHPHYGLINNVVDDFFYDRPDILGKDKSKTHLLHISCFDEQAKNVCGLLRAVHHVATKRQDFTLTLVGSGNDYQRVSKYADSLAFPPALLHWTGELTSMHVAEQFDKADVFVLFSNYENAPVVISESLATGTPIIATRVGSIPDMVCNECGILVSAGDEKGLEQALSKMLDHHSDYDRKVIRRYGKQYSFETVGKQLVTIYQSIINAPVL